MTAYLFDTTNYGSTEELRIALDREMAAISARSGAEIPAYSIEDVETAIVATLWDGSLFISGRLVFPEAGATPPLAAGDALKELRRQAPGGIRMFEFLDEEELA